MSHKVLVGGFVSGERRMQDIAQTMSVYYDEEVEGISFREAMEDPRRLEWIVRGADVTTHSAGMVTIRGTSPETITAIAPPIPVWAPLLAARALASTGELAIHTVLPWQERELTACIGPAATELRTHFRGNMRWVQTISRFDALDTAVNAVEAGIETSVVFMSGDLLFRPSPEAVAVARRFGAGVVHVSGVHETFLERPLAVLKGAEAAVADAYTYATPQHTVGLQAVFDKASS